MCLHPCCHAIRTVNYLLVERMSVTGAQIMSQYIKDAHIQNTKIDILCSIRKLKTSNNKHSSDNILRVFVSNPFLPKRATNLAFALVDQFN